MFDDSATKQLIIEFCEFRDKIGFKSENNDDSNYILLSNDKEDNFKLTEAEVKAIKQVADKDSRLQEISTACHVLLGYFHFAVNY